MWTCSKCNAEIEDTFDSCWRCVDASLSKPQAPDDIGRRPGSRPDEETPLEFIEAVRARSCYSVLRGLVDVFSLLSVAVIIIAGLFLASYEVVIRIAVIVVGCFMIIAGRQSAFLLIDIADTLIEQNRKKK